MFIFIASNDYVKNKTTSSQAVMLFYITQYEPLETEGLRYPLWANLIGWFLCLSSFLCVPFWALYELLKRKGSLQKVCLQNFAKIKIFLIFVKFLLIILVN